MAKKPTITTVQSGFNSQEVINENFQALADALDNTISRDGSTPNTMEADLDLNGRSVIGASAFYINGQDVVSTTADALAAANVAKADAEAAVVNAATSETNAAASATTASTKAAEAAASATAASLSETNAASSETVATAQAGIATTKAAEASASQVAAASSASSASASATAAATSELNADASADAALVSEQAAAVSETNAAASATSASASQVASAASQVAAAASESAAAISEANAAASEAAATTSEANASTSATAAATSETNAAASETNAASSATAAAGSATAAANSASSASASADAALAALDSFDDRYLGQKASDPTLDNDGNPLISGALYYNTTDTIMKVYDGSLWVAAYASLSGAMFGANNLSDVADAAASRTNLGLGTVATTASTDYATAAQGALADSAVQPADLAIVATTGSYSDLSGLPTLGTAAATASTDYATAAQGALADTAVQPNDSPTFASITTTGDLAFGDNNKAIFGAGSDLQIFAVSGNSYISEGGAGSLSIRAADLLLRSPTDENYVVASNNGAVTLYYDNSQKLATTSTGVDVTGTVNVTTVDLGDWTITESAGVLYFATGGTSKMKLDASGNLTVVGDVTAFGTI